MTQDEFYKSRDYQGCWNCMWGTGTMEMCEKGKRLCRVSLYCPMWVNKNEELNCEVRTMDNQDAIKYLTVELDRWESECKSIHPTKDALRVAIESLKHTRKQGTWVEPMDCVCFKCSVCGEYTNQETPDSYFPICPKCGAEMIGKIGFATIDTVLSEEHRYYCENMCLGKDRTAPCADCKHGMMYKKTMKLLGKQAKEPLK